MNAAEFVQKLTDEPYGRACVEYRKTFPARCPVFEPLPEALPSQLREALLADGITELYSHQRAAWEAASQGRDVVVATGTASGKTLCYNLPVLARLLQEPGARAFYLFPTKALAQDQLGKLYRLLQGTSVRAATYDGDTPRDQRSAIRSAAHIVLTNPDMLHVGILPNYSGWLKFLGKLRFVVVDELHAYRGIFGSHVALIMRRLFRLCSSLGTPAPKVIACSATIGNPLELAHALFGRTCALIDEDAAPSGERTFVVWNPMVIGSAGERVSANLDASSLLCRLLQKEIRTIGFARARVTTELMLRYARDRLSEDAPELVRRLESYRGGYTPEERREIERRLFAGDLLGVVATNALELGIDVGGLDAAVINGYPGSPSSFWQQAGRAGRGTRPSAAFFVAHNDPLDQYLVRHPDLLWDARHEVVKVNPANRYVLAQQLRCAAYDKPLGEEEVNWFGPLAKDVLQSLEAEGVLSLQAARYFYAAENNPAIGVDIRSASGPQYVILDEQTGDRIGTVEEERAYQTVHEGATYLHRGQQYLITKLDLEKRTATARPVQVDYYTEAKTEVLVLPCQTIAEQEFRGWVAFFGGVNVTKLVTGYAIRELRTERILGVEDLALPPLAYDTLAVCLTLRFAPSASADEEARLRFAMGLHAAEHALVTALPVLVGCDPGDIGSAWSIESAKSGLPLIAVFDEAPGGVGLCEAGFRQLPQWLSSALSLLEGCPCIEGCPACLLTAWCPRRNELLDKEGGLALLRAMQLSLSENGYNPRW